MTSSSDKATRCGEVVIAGRPNVGKSTLLNAFVGMHLAATASKPQTTRNRILGICTKESSQFIFIDTPGIHLGGKRLLNRALNKTAISSLPDAGVLMFVVEAGKWTEEDEVVLQHIKKVTTCPVVLVVNKVDKIEDRSKLLPYIESLQEKHDFAEIIPISAFRQRNTNYLLKHLEAYLPEKEFTYGEDEITDRNMRFIAAEMIREQLTQLLAQELPYALAVEIEEYTEGDDIVEIGAVIYVEREGQKGIVIGDKGKMLKAVGIKARKRLIALLDQRVHLRLWVKVKGGWQDNANLLNQFGIEN